MSTLKDYYNGLPSQTSPKVDFINKVAENCEVSPQTVKLWIRGKVKPSRREFYRKLSELTGIPENDLFSSYL